MPSSTGSSSSNKYKKHRHHSSYKSRSGNDYYRNDNEGKSREYALPGTSSLHEMLDHRILILLRDQRTLIADLKSYDQFSNLVLENCLERICIKKKYGDLPLGTQLIRGENIHMLGTFQEEKMVNQEFTEVSLEEILMLQKEERLRKEKEEREMRQKGLRLGLEGKEIEDSIV
mmetsp:Transcript_4619/g.17437  ORF Transcript_4619/g.17437 Transcript_4619/m.17437 type:complete len:173 (-) Transcript_4619:109-627(-)